MGRINVNDVENYGNKSGMDFFKLADDGDKAIVRFYHNGMDDVEALAIHNNVDVGGKSRKISCLRDKNDPEDACPLCEAGEQVSARLFINLLVYAPVAKGENAGLYLNPPTVQIWERGAGFKKQLQSLINRYASNGKKLIDNIFEIERSGKKGDQQTQYLIYPVTDLDDDECPLPDPEKQPKIEALGTIVMDKDYDELAEFVETGKFPQKDTDEKPERAERTERTERAEPVAERRNRVETPAAEPQVTPRRRRI